MSLFKETIPSPYMNLNEKPVHCCNTDLLGILLMVVAVVVVVMVVVVVEVVL